MDDVQTPVLRDERGRFLAPPPNAAPPITSDTARAMVQRRIAKFRAASARGAKRAAMAIDPTVATVYDAHALLVERAYTEAMDKPRADLLDHIAKSYGAVPLPHEREQEQGGATATLTLSPDMVALLAEVARVQRQGDGGAAAGVQQVSAAGLVGGGGDG